MTPDADRSGGGDESLEERQLQLDDLDPVDPDRCEAFADSTGERCKHPAMSPFPYCQDHIDDLLDPDDWKQTTQK